jgi:hypothetical protein
VLGFTPTLGQVRVATNMKVSLMEVDEETLEEEEVMEVVMEVVEVNNQTMTQITTTAALLHIVPFCEGPNKKSEGFAKEKQIT